MVFVLQVYRYMLFFTVYSWKDILKFIFPQIIWWRKHPTKQPLDHSLLFRFLPSNVSINLIILCCLLLRFLPCNISNHLTILCCVGSYHNVSTHLTILHCLVSYYLMFRFVPSNVSTHLTILWYILLRVLPCNGSTHLTIPLLLISVFLSVFSSFILDNCTELFFIFPSYK